MIYLLKTNSDIWQCSLHIIARRSHSEHELQQKLHYKNYSFDDIKLVMDRLREYGYINDVKLAKNLFNKYLQADKYSLKQIVNKLKQRGLADSIINDTANSYDYSEEWQSALKIVRNRFKLADTITKEKIYRFLATKGYSSASITKALHHFYHSENS